MSEKVVAVPQSELDKVEESRRKLFELAEELGWDVNNNAMLLMRLMDITSPLWHVANRKWPEVNNETS